MDEGTRPPDEAGKSAAAGRPPRPPSAKRDPSGSATATQPLHRPRSPPPDAPRPEQSAAGESAPGPPALPRPLLNWALILPSSQWEAAYWDHQAHALLLWVDRLVWGLSFLVTLSLCTTSTAGGVAGDALHPWRVASLLLLAVQAVGHTVFSSAYLKRRTWVIVGLRLWRVLMLFQTLPLMGAERVAVAADVDIRSFLRNVLLLSGTVPNCVYAWAYQVPWRVLVLLQLFSTAATSYSESGTLLQLLNDPMYLPLVDRFHSAMSRGSAVLTWLLYGPSAYTQRLRCSPPCGALTTLLWMQIYIGLLLPLFIMSTAERRSKTGYWLQTVARLHPNTPPPETAAAMAEVCPSRLAVVVVKLLALAVLSWQFVEALQWGLLSRLHIC